MHIHDNKGEKKQTDYLLTGPRRLTLGNLTGALRTARLMSRAAANDSPLSSLSDTPMTSVVHPRFWNMSCTLPDQYNPDGVSNTDFGGFILRSVATL